MLTGRLATSKSARFAARAIAKTAWSNASSGSRLASVDPEHARTVSTARYRRMVFPPSSQPHTHGDGGVNPVSPVSRLPVSSAVVAGRSRGSAPTRGARPTRGGAGRRTRAAARGCRARKTSGCPQVSGTTGRSLYESIGRTAPDIAPDIATPGAARFTTAEMGTAIVKHLEAG